MDIAHQASGLSNDCIALRGVIVHRVLHAILAGFLGFLAGRLAREGQLIRWCWGGRRMRCECGEKVSRRMIGRSEEERRIDPYGVPGTSPEPRVPGTSEPPPGTPL